jgi:hypothetical protein
MKTSNTKSGQAKPSPGGNFARHFTVAAIATRQVKTIVSCNGRLLVALLFVPTLLFAQPYSVDWYKVSGGGGTSTNGQFSLSGTIGQPDASGAMSGGSYSLTGGFWAFYAVQTTGLPMLFIIPSGANSAMIFWADPATNTYALQENSNLANTAAWNTSTDAITSANGTNSVTVIPPATGGAGGMFFRLISRP